MKHVYVVQFDIGAYSDHRVRIVTAFDTEGAAERFCARACRRFYQGKSPQLKGLITEQQRRRIERRMLKLCHVAYRAFSEQRQYSWRRLRKTAWQEMEAAA